MTVPGPETAGPFDPGLQPERTELAWRRTALAIAIGSLVSLRIFPLVLPPPLAALGFVPGAIGLVAACALWFAARRRLLRTTAWLHSTKTGPTQAEQAPDGPTQAEQSPDGPTQAEQAPEGPTQGRPTQAIAPGGGMLLALTALATAFGALSIGIVLVSSLLADAS